MIFEINFTNEISFEKGWTELEMLCSQLMGDMKLAKGVAHFAIVELEEIDDTVALMKTLKEMANKNIHWQLTANWWNNTDEEG